MSKGVVLVFLDFLFPKINRPNQMPILFHRNSQLNEVDAPSGYRVLYITQAPSVRFTPQQLSRVCVCVCVLLSASPLRPECRNRRIDAMTLSSRRLSPIIRCI